MNTKTILTQIRPLSSAQMRMQYARDNASFAEMDLSMTTEAFKFLSEQHDKKLTAGEYKNSMASSAAKYIHASMYLFEDATNEQNPLRACIFVILTQEGNTWMASAFSHKIPNSEFAKVWEDAKDGGFGGQLVGTEIENMITEKVLVMFEEMNKS